MDMEEYKQIIEQAIDKEVEAYVFYQAVYEKVKDPNVKSIFKELAEEEKGHRKLLEDSLAGGAKALKFDESRDYKISETFERPKPTVNMKPIEGIEIAIKREEDAMEMYEQFADLCIDADQRNVFLELAKMEREHKARLEDLYTEMAFPESW